MREGVLQQLQLLDSMKMTLSEQKLAEQARLCNDLDVRLQAACATLDVSAGMLLWASDGFLTPAGRQADEFSHTQYRGRCSV